MAENSVIAVAFSIFSGSATPIWSNEDLRREYPIKTMMIAAALSSGVTFAALCTFFYMDFDDIDKVNWSRFGLACDKFTGVDGVQYAYVTMPALVFSGVNSSACIHPIEEILK